MHRLGFVTHILAPSTNSSWLEFLCGIEHSLVISLHRGIEQGVKDCDEERRNSYKLTMLLSVF